MRSARQLPALFMCLFSFLSSVLAQDAQPAATISKEVTIVIEQQRVRFTGRSAVEQMQLQVFNQSGEIVYDSGVVAQPEINWPLQNGAGEDLKNGLYAYTLSIKEIGAETARVRRGHFIVDRVKERDGADKLWVTSQSDGGVGAELTVARNENATVAGIVIGGRTVEGRQERTSREGSGRGVELEARNQAEASKIAGMTAAGTVGKIAKFTSETEVGDSVITELNGNIGVGAATPSTKLAVQTVAGAYGLTHTDGAITVGSYVGGSQSGAAGGWLGTASNHDLHFFTNNGQPSLTIKPSSNVGIGTTAPQAALEVVGNWDGGRAALRLSGQKPSIQFADTNGASGRQLWLLHLGANGGGNLEFYNGSAGIPTIAMQPGTGNVGIGTANPETRLHVDGTGFVEATIRSFNERAILALSNRIGPSYYVWTVESGVRGIPTQFGIYNRTVGRSGLEIDGSLQVTVRSLRLDGGADLAENFDVRAETAAASASGSVGAPEMLGMAGMVVSIDPQNPGKLRVSSRAYDRRVAGIISGAGGVKPGMVMGQEGTLADGKHPVALSGRVYVWVDATRHAVKPGDLLTTSATPGHAMKAGNPQRAQGAIIGKAMTGLKSGKGLVLALITLQ
ncbi:MAG: hypothetical protein ACREBD_18405 [Blastocatellia bacterium]